MPGRLCPHCGGAVDDATFDDDKTPVDIRLEKYAEGNVRLMEAAVEQARAELDRQVAANARLQARVDELVAKEVELDVIKPAMERQRLEFNQLKAAMRTKLKIP